MSLLFLSYIVPIFAWNVPLVSLNFLKRSLVFLILLFSSLFCTVHFFFTLFCFTILYWFCHTSTWIRHGYTWVPNPEPPSHLPPHIISLDHPCAPAPSILYPVSNIDWRFVSYKMVYVFQCHSPKSSHPLPLPLPQSLKVCSIHLCLLLSHIQGYHYRLSKLHICVLVYCIGGFLSGFLHCIIGSSFIYLIRTDSNVSFLMAE